MNKTELIQSLSEETTLSKKDVTRVLDGFFRAVVRSLKKGDKLQWSGFGSFTVSCRAEREIVDPVTRQRRKLSATYVPKFKPGKNFKELIRSANELNRAAGSRLA